MEAKRVFRLIKTLDIEKSLMGKKILLILNKYKIRFSSYWYNLEID